MSASPMPAQKLLSFSDLGTNSGAVDLQAGPTSSSIKASQGTFTANGATTVVVADTRVTANSIILNTIKTVGGTPSPTSPNVILLAPGVGFSIKSTALDTSVYNYVILG